MNITRWHKDNNLLPLKIGDIVRIREDLVLGEIYDGVRCTEDMLYFRGAATRVERTEDADGHYLLAADDKENEWSRKMLGFADKESLKNNKQLVVGSWVRVADADAIRAWLKQRDYDDEYIKSALKNAEKEGVISGFNWNHKLCHTNIAGQSGEHIVWSRELFTPIHKDWHVYEPGEKVRIRSDIELGRKYDGGCECVEEMMPYRGECSKIVRIYKENRFLLEITGGMWWWSPSMLEPIEGD